jgi:hypothetical protein
MKNFLTLTLVLLSLSVFGQPTVKKITDYTPYAAPLGAGGFIPVSINNGTRSVEAYWINRGSIDSLKTSLGTFALAANVYSKTASDARYLQNETDPKRVTAVTFTGTSTKTLTVTFADGTTTSNTFTDLQGTGGTGSSTLSGLSDVTLTSLATNQSIRWNGTAFVNYTTDKASVGLSNVDNTSDANKPISTATQTALNGKVPVTPALVNTTASYKTVDSTKLAGIASGGGSTDTSIMHNEIFARWDSTKVKQVIHDSLVSQMQASLWTDDYTIKGNGDSLSPLHVDTTVIKTTWRAKQDSLALVAQMGSGGGGGTGTPVGANMYRLATQSFSAGVDTKVLLDNIQFDNNGTLADLTNKRINISATGIYIITISGRVTTSASGEFVLKAFKNGSTEILRAGVLGGDPVQINGSQVVSLAAGDYVELFIYSGYASSTLGSSFPNLAPRISIAQIK